MDINNRNSTRLCLNVIKGYYKDFDELISNGADVNYQHADGNTALMLAIIHGRTDFVNLLTMEKYEASVLVRNNKGRNAIELVQEFGSPIAVKNVARRAAIEMKRMYSPKRTAVAICHIISQVSGIEEKEISRASNLRTDLMLYSGKEGYNLAGTKMWKVIERIEHFFWLDTKIMDGFYNKFFDPEIKGEHTVRALAKFVNAVIVNRDRITIPT